MDEKLQAQIEEARAQGYTEEQIQAFMAAEQRGPMSTPTQDQFTPRFEEGVGTAQYAAAEAAKYAAIGGGGYYGAKKVAEALRGPKAVPGPVAPAVAPAIEAGGQAVKDFVQQQGRYAPTTPAPVSGAPGQTSLAAGRAPVLGTMAAQGMLAAPYLGAAYEQARIRANPNAPEYKDNPYAMMTRGEAATQGQAGAMNTRSALSNQQYGGLTAEQQQILEQDRIRQAIRRKAAEKVLGPVIPQGY
jgi:hypothetical protein